MTLEASDFSIRPKIGRTLGSGAHYRARAISKTYSTSQKKELSSSYTTSTRGLSQIHEAMLDNPEGVARYLTLLSVFTITSRK